jgi:hypothetical protein
MGRSWNHCLAQTLGTALTANLSGQLDRPGEDVRQHICGLVQAIQDQAAAAIGARGLSPVAGGTTAQGTGPTPAAPETGYPWYAMRWRAAVIAGYAALAVIVAVGDGMPGLEILAFYYAWAGIWVVFLLAWGRIARDAGAWNHDRLLEHDPADDGHDPGRRGGVEPLPAAAPEARSPVPAGALAGQRTGGAAAAQQPPVIEAVFS